MRLPPITSRWRSRGQAGQAAIEFALVMPFVLVVAFFLVEGVALLSTWSVMQHASREGARVGAVRKPQDQIVQATVDRSAGALTSSNVTVTNAQGTPGSTIQVSVRREYRPNVLNGFTTTFLGVSMPTITLRAQTQMRLEE